MTRKVIGVDVVVEMSWTEGDQTVVTFLPKTEQARDWLRHRVASRWPWSGGRLQVEPADAVQVVEQLREEGLRVRT